MHHFGASDGWGTEVIGGNWPESDREHISELLFSREVDIDGKPLGIGLSMWRTNIGAGSANQVNNGFAPDAWFRATECVLSPDGNYDWDHQSGARWFLTKAKDYGVEYTTGWITSPPYFMTQNGYTFSTSEVAGYNLQQDKYDDFAEYIAEYITHYSSLGIKIDYLSPLNEPQWKWAYAPGEAAQEGTSASNQEAQRLVSELDKVFKERNISSRIILPEAGELKSLYSFNNSAPEASDQINAFWNATNTSYLGDYSAVERLMAGHSYWSNSDVNTAIGHRTILASQLNNYNLGFWQTEYSILGGDYLEGRNENELHDIDYSLWLARIIHWDLTLANATGWSFWTALNYPVWADHKFRFGLLNWYPDSENPSNSSGEIEETKNLWALGNFSRFIRPGYRRIEIENELFSSLEQEANNLMVSGYVSQDQKQLVMVFVNYSKKDIEVPVLNYDEAGLRFTNDELQVYRTDYAGNLEPDRVKVDDLMIRSKSIVTVVGQLNK